MMGWTPGGDYALLPPQGQDMRAQKLASFVLVVLIQAILIQAIPIRAVPTLEPT